jgi:hypothetical protein
MMKKIIAAVVVITCFLANDTILWASECLEIEESLRIELGKEFLKYEIVNYDELSQQENQKFAQLAKDSCSYVVALTPSLLAILLKDKQSGLYQLVQAEFSSRGTSKKWAVVKVEVFSDEIPLIEKAKAGFYTDVVTSKKVTITRYSAALLVIMSRSGKQYILKKSKAAGFDRFQIK